ncbi:hypothetical protein RGUI_3169 [Rhodovulum sp. P5]|uniref:hypothetical protein n=1 Tax=Rhodovulum sp. P5 TaxID=1564506 RepID=UPI0009C1D362|nr:hypothetical protein [Rhodovulum sp. P5]ARE41310.1 hypothetical protein RGUI_3169 [Rhodovulum sp. P5]
MQTEFDIILERLRAVEALLEKGRVEDARESLASLRDTLARLLPEANPVPLHRKPMGFSGLQDLLAQAEKSKDMSLPVHRFTSDLRCWGWYDAQVDASGRHYRWCGEAAEAGVLLDLAPEGLVGLAVRMRPLASLGLKDAQFEVRIDGERAELSILPPVKGVYTALIAVTHAPTEAPTEVVFYPKATAIPKKTGESSDTRKLAFNVIEILELHRPKDGSDDNTDTDQSWHSRHSKKSDKRPDTTSNPSSGKDSGSSSSAASLLQPIWKKRGGRP